MKYFLIYSENYLPKNNELYDGYYYLSENDIELYQKNYKIDIICRISQKEIKRILSKKRKEKKLIIGKEYVDNFSVFHFDKIKLIKEEGSKYVFSSGNIKLKVDKKKCLIE